MIFTNPKVQPTRVEAIMNFVFLPPRRSSPWPRPLRSRRLRLLAARRPAQLSVASSAVRLALSLVRRWRWCWLGRRAAEEVVTYVQHEQVPTAAPTVQGEIVVGKPVPSTVELRAVPTDSKFRYAFVNHERVIVDADTGKVVKIID